MPVGYEFEIRGLEAHLRKMEQYPQIADEEVARAMNQSVFSVVAEVRPLVPVGVSGQLRQSITGEVKNEGGIIGRVFSAIDEAYPSVMEFGRAPGSMPPPEALERWVHLKLGVPEAEAPGAAFTVARAIGRRGIAGRFFMRRGWEAAQARVNGFFGAALKRLAERLSSK